MKLLLAGLMAAATACSPKTGPAQKAPPVASALQQPPASQATPAVVAAPQQAPASPGIAPMSGLPQVVVLPTATKPGSSLVVKAPRWGAGVRVLQFDLLYTGDAALAQCGYQEFDANDDPVGPGGVFQVGSANPTTESLTLSNAVTMVKLTPPHP